MYLTKNSRYVLQRAKCVSPSFCFLDCLKENKRNYSVKPPKDDPTKPPLRINIPNDSAKKQESQNSSAVLDQAKVHKKDTSQTRSKSLLSKSSNKESFTKTYEKDFENVPVDDSDIQHEKYSESPQVDNRSAQESFSINEEKKPEIVEKIAFQKTKNFENVVPSSNEKVLNESIQKSATSTDQDSAQNKNQEISSTKSETEKVRQSTEEDGDQKALYIIIDVPEEQQKNPISSKSTHQPEKISPGTAYFKVDYNALKAVSEESLPSKVPKLEWHTNTNSLNKVLEKRSRSLPSHSNKAADGESEGKINFQVHEIDEAATYVLHLKFKKNLNGKSFAVGCVPEKELNMRIEGMTENNEQVKGIKTSFVKNRPYKGLHKDNTAEGRVEPVKHEPATHQNKSSRKDSIELLKKSYKSAKSLSGSSTAIPKPMIETKKEPRKATDQHTEEVVKTDAEEPITSIVTDTKGDRKSLTNIASAKPKAQDPTFEKPIQNVSSEISPEVSTEKPVTTSENAVELDSSERNLKVNNPVHENFTNTDLNTSSIPQYAQNSSKPDKNVADDQAYDQSLQQYYSEYYQQQAAANANRQQSHDPDAKEYYYYTVDQNSSQQESAVESPVTSIDHPSESAQKVVRNVNFQKPNFRKKKPEKTNKSDSKKGKDVKFSSPTSGSYKCTDRDTREPVNFHTSANVVKISSDSTPNPVKFCAAYPPHVNEFLINRRKARLNDKNRFFNPEATKLNFTRNKLESVSSQKEGVKGLSDDSILFSKSEENNFDCPSIFQCKKNDVLPVLNTDEKSPRISDNMVNMVNETLSEEKGEPSLDSLTMMKKVKEIVNFDLNNAVKLFEDRKTESDVEITSVIINKENAWKVDEAALEKCILQRKALLMRDSEMAMSTSNKSERQFEENFKKIEKNHVTPKFFPGKKQSENAMKLLKDSINSVIVYNPDLGMFHVDKSGLEEAVQEGIEKFNHFYFQSITQPSTFPNKTQNIKSKFARILPDSSRVPSPKLEMKGGDSILVFDELTQTWKVDFTILEKREEQIRQEKELTERSELILESIEKLEKENISDIRKPNTREKKIFDYTSEEWKTYRSDERPISSDKKLIKSKHPFKETDAEEIRKKNSDLYENLFVVNKKDTTMTEEGKEAPGMNTSDAKKEAGSKNKKLTKDSEKSNTPPPSDTGNTPKDSDKPHVKEKQIDNTPKEEDNYWERFLKTNILPFDRPVQPPKPPIPTPQPPIIDKKPNVPKIKAPPPKRNKIEEKRFKIPYPFSWDRKIDSEKIKTPSNKENKPLSTPSKITPSSKPEQTSSTNVTKTENTTAKTSIQSPSVIKNPPSPSAENTKKENPITKPIPTPPNLPKPSPSVTDTPKKENPITKPIPTPPNLPKPSPSATDTTKKGNLSSKPEDLEINKQKKKIPIDILKLNLPIPTRSQNPKPPSISESQKPKTSPSSSAPPSSTSLPSKNPDVKNPTPPASSDPIKPNVNSSSTTSSVIDHSKKEPSTPEITNTSKSPPPEKRIDPGPKSTPTIGSPLSDKPDMKVLRDPNENKGDLKTKGVSVNVEKKEKTPSEHYVSDNILEMSKSSAKDLNSKSKSNKIETVRVNVVPDKRVPSKITEINLNKKCEETTQDLGKNPKTNEKPKSSKKSLKSGTSSSDSKFYKNFEKYKTPFSDPDYEEKSMKINSDIESNPNLKKLDSWNKTLVLHDVAKPPENIETWLKDETDKMATLLLKVLQEAAEGKPRKKPVAFKGKSSERSSSKGNPYDSIRKKQETTPESFLLKVNSVNVALESQKKLKEEEKLKLVKPKSEQLNEKDIPVQSGKTAKPSRIVDIMKVSDSKDSLLSPRIASKTQSQSGFAFADPKNKLTELTVEPIDANVVSGEVSQFKVVTELTDDIPGPEILKKISSTWKLFPVLGCQLTIFILFKLFQLVNLSSSIFSSTPPGKSKRHEFSNLFVKYGPIVNLQGPLSGNVVLIYKPEHLSAVFEQDALSPTRSIFDSLEQSRRDIDEKFLQTGIVTDWSKAKWNALKKDFSDPLVKGCENFFESVELAGDGLVNIIRRNRNNQNMVSEDFMLQIKRWSLDGLCGVLLARSFGFLESRSHTSNWLLEPDKLFLAIEEATECLSKCERGFQIWRLMATSSLLGLGQAYRTLSTVLSKQLYQAELGLRNKNEQIEDGIMSVNAVGLTYLESMLLFDGMTPEEITCNLIDTLIMGTNIMSSSLGFLLYRLAQDVKVQSRLFKEVKAILPEKSSRLDYQKLNSLKYLQACLKESLRLNPPLPFFFRLLQNDILLSNYVVPKGTYVVMDSRMSSTKEQIFEEPEKFIPERWLNEDKWLENSHPFSSFPLCHGSRSDLAKQIVEMQLCSCAAKIIRNFQIEYHFGEISGTDNVISFPDKPLKFSFIERKD